MIVGGFASPFWTSLIITSKRLSGFGLSVGLSNTRRTDSEVSRRHWTAVPSTLPIVSLSLAEEGGSGDNAFLPLLVIGSIDDGEEEAG